MLVTLLYPFFDKALSKIHSVSTDLSTHNLLCLIPAFYTLFPLLDIVPNRLSNSERKCISQTMSFITSYATAKMCAKNWNRQTIMYELLMVNYWYIHMNSNPSNTPIIRDIYQYRYNIIMYVCISHSEIEMFLHLIASRAINAIINHLALSMIICFLRKCS